MIPVLFIVSVILFVLLRMMPIDPIYSMIGEEDVMLTPEMHAVKWKELGLDRPYPVQYFDWMKKMLTGDWGRSFQNRLPVAGQLASRIPFSMQLFVAAYVLGVVLGVTFGIIAALKRNTILDFLATSGAMFGVAVPDFWFALMLILLFVVALDWLPVYGATLVWKDPLKGLE